MSVQVGPGRAVNVPGRSGRSGHSGRSGRVDLFDLVDGADDLGDDDFYGLFVGEPGESAEDAAVRNLVAWQVYAELVTGSADDPVGEENAEYAAWLLTAAPLLRRLRGGTHAAGPVTVGRVREAA
jgi:hypothetical protein